MSMMQEKPKFDHYDSGEDGPYAECRSCHYHRPYRSDRFCRYTECPFTPGRRTTFPKANPVKGGDAQGKQTCSGKTK